MDDASKQEEDDGAGRVLALDEPAAESGDQDSKHGEADVQLSVTDIEPGSAYSKQGNGKIEKSSGQSKRNEHVATIQFGTSSVCVGVKFLRGKCR